MIDGEARYILTSPLTHKILYNYSLIMKMLAVGARLD